MANKRIAFTIRDNGVDGREPTRIVSAFWDEGERDKSFDKDKNKAYLSKGEEIIDTNKALKEALAKLNGIDKLILADFDF